MYAREVSAIKNSIVTHIMKSEVWFTGYTAMEIYHGCPKVLFHPFNTVKNVFVQNQIRNEGSVLEQMRRRFPESF